MENGIQNKGCLKSGKIIIIVLGCILLLMLLLVAKSCNNTDEKSAVKINDGNKQNQSQLPVGIDSNDIKRDIDSMLHDFIKEDDEFQKITFYTHKIFGKNWNNRNTIRVVVRGNGSYYMESNYYGKDWLFHNQIIILINGSTISSPQIMLTDKAHKTDNTAYEVWEVNDYNNDNAILGNIAALKNKEIKVRFVGQQNDVDATLSKADKDAIAESYDLATDLGVLHKFR